MDRRSYSIGFSAGQFFAQDSIGKNDIIEFFAKQNKKDNCETDCPFVDACDKILEMSNDENTLCELFGIEEDEE